MSQAGKWVWGRFPYSRITTVSCMWRYTKWIWRLVRIITCPLQPHTGNPTGPSTLGEEALYSLGYCVADGITH